MAPPWCALPPKYGNLTKISLSKLALFGLEFRQNDRRIYRENRAGVKSSFRNRDLYFYRLRWCWKEQRIRSVNLAPRRQGDTGLRLPGRACTLAAVFAKGWRVDPLVLISESLGLRGRCCCCCRCCCCRWAAAFASCPSWPCASSPGYFGSHFAYL